MAEAARREGLAADHRGVRSLARAPAGALGIHRRPAAADGAGVDETLDHQGQRAFAGLYNAFVGTPCRALVDGPQILTDEISAIPDIVVTCSAIDLSTPVIAEPVIIVEVMSPSSEADDAGANGSATARSRASGTIWSCPRTSAWRRCTAARGTSGASASSASAPSSWMIRPCGSRSRPSTPAPISRLDRLAAPPTAIRRPRCRRKAARSALLAGHRHERRRDAGRSCRCRTSDMAALSSRARRWFRPVRRSRRIAHSDTRTSASPSPPPSNAPDP